MKFASRFVATLLAALAVGAVDAAAEVALPPFYASVAKMAPAGKLGQVVKQERVTTSVAGAQAWRIAYVSSDVQGRKTLATALVMAPTGKAPAAGRPIVAWAHGTTGTAQNCGPSQVPDPARSLNQYFLVDGNSWTDYGLPAVEALIQEGYVVVATDYQGLGGGGAHQYSVAATNARDVINSARAVGAMKDAAGGRKAVVYGWSQGGGAVLAAAGLRDYIAQKGSVVDGIDFVGFVALAPFDAAVTVPATTIDTAAAEKAFGDLATNFSGNVFNFAHFAMFTWGTQAAFPGLRLTDVFTDDGAKILDEILSNKCMHVAADTMNNTFGADFKALLRPKAGNALAWTNAMVVGSVAPVKPVGPVVIYWGTKDTVVPPAMGQAYREQMCKLGANVTRVQLDGAQTHFSTPGAAAPLYLPWIKDRISGQPVADGCAAGS